MKTKNISWKTSILGIVCLLNLAVSIVTVFMKIATWTDIGIYLGISTPLIVGLKSFFEKDSDKTGLPEN